MIIQDTPAYAVCRICDGTCYWVPSPTGGWWAHVIHPDDDHDIELRGQW